MKRVLGAAALAVLMGAGPAQAGKWFFKTGEDPLEDKPIAIAAISQEGFQAFNFGIKCWQGKPATIAFTLVTPLPFDSAASYKDPMTIGYRIDKGTVKSIDFKPREIGGRLGFTMESTSDEPDSNFLNELGDAKSRIVFVISEQIVLFNVSNSGSTIANVKKTCTIDTQGH